jgi:iron complex outermembrane receptor protein
MQRLKYFRSALIGGVSVAVLASPAAAKVFDVPRGDLAAALDAYSDQSGVQIVYSEDAVRGHRSEGAKGNFSEFAALTQILRGTGFAARSTPSSVIGIVPQQAPVMVAQAAPRRAPVAPMPAAPAAVETIVVTAQHKSENIQQVPIAISAFSQQELTERQIAGGPDLVKEVPNLTFSKTNFTGYNLQIRGIGTQAISVTTDPAVAVAFNGVPFIRNHFFEQEFFDVGDAEVLRGPQGTLYGRNATAGVFNLVSAKPTDQYEAMGSVDVGNYNERRLEGMINLPIVGDTLDIRIAGEWTKRDGYTFDRETNQSVDGRDLWSGRMTIGWKPTSDLQAYLVWEHFSEDDDRLRSGKQLCTTDNGPSVVNGPAGPQTPNVSNFGGWLSQGCSPGSLYGAAAFETPNAIANPFIAGLEYFPGFIPLGANPYAGVAQSQNLRVIDSQLMPSYRAKNDAVELNANYSVASDLTLTSQTGYNNDFLYSTEDYNRFNSAPELFADTGNGLVGQDGQFCDPQLGCSSRLVGEDVSEEHAQQFSQEVRLASNYNGPLNFSVGANFLHYQTVEDYYVFYNGITLLDEYLDQIFGAGPGSDMPHIPFNAAHANSCGPVQSTYPPNLSSSFLGTGCSYVDPDPLSQVNGQGHNYFLSENPYILNSFAGFGEVYYQLTPDLKLTGGLRWTDDMKSFTEIPSWTLLAGEGYPVAGVLDQSWREWTGRFNVSWTPQLDFTDQSLFYGSYSRGYKGGGANPPGVVPVVLNGITLTSPSDATHPLTFKPEFVDAFELGTKNTLLDGAVTFNGDIFYYKYQNYQISQIVDRTSVNLNFNANVEGAELESTWEPLPGLRFNVSGGYENAPLAKGSQAIDLMDRTAGQPGWMVVKPYITQTSNCVLPTDVVNEFLARGGGLQLACLAAYSDGLDPVTEAPYAPNPAGYPGYAGFNPATAPNSGEGFFKNLSGNQLPNTPPFTLSFGSQYSLPVSADWAATLRGDFYWQGNTEARVFNDKPYDSIHGYTNLNLALIFANDDGWQAMFYVKNVFDVTAITGAFLNSDDSGLTTNVFLTDPRLFGVRVTKSFGGADARESDRGWIDNHIDDYFDDVLDYLTDKDGGRPPLWIELGGQYALLDESQQRYAPSFISPTATIPYPATLPSPLPAQKLPDGSFDWNGKVSFEPDGSDWVFSASIRYGRSSGLGHVQKTLAPATIPSGYARTAGGADFVNSKSYEQETHAILDFMVGKDVGLGMSDGTSVLSGGVRIAQFASGLMTNISADPDYHWRRTNPQHQEYHDIFNGAAQAKHSFRGIGPAISWDAFAPIAGNAHDGEITFDWGANAAMLFGRRTADIHHQTSQCHKGVYQSIPCAAVYTTHGTIHRSRQVTVPNLGGFAGISMRYSNARISFGYRADEFFGAMDGGFASEKTYNLGFFGPFVNISIGIGG